MATKLEKTIPGIFTEAIGLYFANFTKFIKYMSFPIWGQILGLIIISMTTYFYSQNLPNLLAKYPNLNDYKILLALSIIITLPGLAIFTKAFWEYLVAYGAVNSMLENLLKSGKVYDFEAHTERIKRRRAKFIGLWFLVGAFSVFAICPLFWVICGIIAIYCILIFQVFTFEEDLSSIECIKRSGKLIKGHFAQTLTMALLAGMLTYLFIPQIFNKLLELSTFTTHVANLIAPMLNIFPIEDINNFLSHFGNKQINTVMLAVAIIQSFVANILIQYTLPLRSIMWSMWYKNLSKQPTKEPYGEYEQKNTTKRKYKKRPSEKLMENSHKKFTQMKLDDNILRRASEKDDED